MKSTQAMRDRIRELMNREQDDYDRAVECVVDDLEALLNSVAPMQADIAQIIDAGWRSCRPSAAVAAKILQEFERSPEDAKMTEDIRKLETALAQRDALIRTLEGIRDQRWNENADLDAICNTAKQALRSVGVGGDQS